MKKRIVTAFMAAMLSATLVVPAYADNSLNPFSGNKTITGNYNITSTGEALKDAYDTPIDKTDVTAINDPDRFCELMNQYRGFGKTPSDSWSVDWSKPVVESGQSNIYYKLCVGDSRDIPDACYRIIKTSKERTWYGDGEQSIYELRVYGFENGYLLVNTTRNGIYFNERGEAVVNGAVVKHTNKCYYGDNKWHTTLATIGTLYWDDLLTWEGNPIFYHTHYNINPYINPNKANMNESGQVFEAGFGACCDESLYNFVN